MPGPICASACSGRFHRNFTILARLAPSQQPLRSRSLLAGSMPRSAALCRDGSWGVRAPQARRDVHCPLPRPPDSLCCAHLASKGSSRQNIHSRQPWRLPDNAVSSAAMAGCWQVLPVSPTAGPVTALVTQPTARDVPSPQRSAIVPSAGGSGRACIISQMNFAHPSAQ